MGTRRIKNTDFINKLSMPVTFKPISATPEAPRQLLAENYFQSPNPNIIDSRNWFGHQHDFRAVFSNSYEITKNSYFQMFSFGILLNKPIGQKFIHSGDCQTVDQQLKFATRFFLSVQVHCHFSQFFQSLLFGRKFSDFVAPRG